MKSPYSTTLMDAEAQKPRHDPQVTVREVSRYNNGTQGHNNEKALDRHLSRHESTVAATSNRLPVEFRTLSIHVQTRVSSDDGKAGGVRRVDMKELASLDWHKISVDDALQRLAVSPKTGLETAQAQRRLHSNGKNVISPPKSNMLRKVLEWVLGGFGSLLLAASIVCFVAWKPLGEPNPQASNLALAVVLLIVLAIQAVFNAWQDFSTSRVMTSIKGMLPSDVLAIRDSIQVKVAAAELVTGDLVHMSLGEKVPADLKLIEVSGDLQFDRSILTGESEPVAGRIEMTDDNILDGRIAKLSSMEPTRLTTLQWEILRFVGIIAGLATLVAVIIVILWAAWLRRSFPSYINVPTLLIDVVSVMVAFIPEGLPVAVTLSLAKVANTLSKHKVLCKSLSIVETLGAVNVLCSDKTGTLTQNKMHVENVSVFDTEFGSANFRSTIDNASPEAASNLVQIAAVGAICNAANFEETLEKTKEKGVIGDATDVAIFRFADHVVSIEVTRHRWQEVFRINFNSKTKFMLKLSKLSPMAPLDSAPLASWDKFSPSDYLLTVKGAPEILLPRCAAIVDPNGGSPLPLSLEVISRITRIQEKWAKDGQRVLLLARKVVKGEMIPSIVDRYSEEFSDAIESCNQDLVIVGFLGLIDPLKPDIKHTVSVCRGAGIRFFVITGDHPTTAVAIAGQAGIVTDTKRIHHSIDLNPSPVYDSSSGKLSPLTDDYQFKSIVLTGAELHVLNHAQMDQLFEYEEIVFARTTPEQKLRVVNELKKRRNVVAVTGDGVNDAPSLKAADCGIAMGQGSDIAREAADMVLLEDFSAIVVALEYGRLVFDNLKKTVLYLLPAGSFSELMPIVLNILIGVPQMLSNIQMIIICVATDVLPALSMCLEQPESGLLLRKPRNIRTERLADWRLLLQAYGFLGVLESLCAMTMSFWYLQRHGVPFTSLVLGFGNWPGLDDELFFRAQSVYFFTLVLMQWGNLFATRGRRLSIVQHSPTSNWYIFLAAGMALCIGIFFCYVPWFQKVFQTRPIPVEHFFIPMTFGLGLLILDELRKLVVRKYPKSILAVLAW